MLPATKKTSNTTNTLRRSSTVTPGHNAYKKLLLLLICAGLTLLTTARAKPTLSFQLPTSLTIPSFSTSFSQYVERKQAEKMKTFRWVRRWGWLQGLISGAQFPCHTANAMLLFVTVASGWMNAHCGWFTSTIRPSRLWNWDHTSCSSAVNWLRSSKWHFLVALSILIAPFCIEFLSIIIRLTFTRLQCNCAGRGTQFEPITKTQRRTLIHCIHSQCIRVFLCSYRNRRVHHHHKCFMISSSSFYIVIIHFFYLFANG